MSIETTDYKFSGLSPLQFSAALGEFLRISEGGEVRSVHLVCLDGQRIRMSVDASPSKMDLSSVRRAEIEISIPSVPTTVYMWAIPEAAGSTPGTVIDGMLYVGHVLASAARPADALRTLAQAVAYVAIRLEVVFVVVSDEDDASLQVQPGDLRLPSLFGVYQRALVQDVFEKLRSVGAVVDSTFDPRYVLLWPAAAEELFEGSKRPQAAIEILRHQLMTNPVLWSLETRRFS